MYAPTRFPAAQNITSSYERRKYNLRRDLLLREEILGETWFYQRLANDGTYPKILVEVTNEFARAKEEEEKAKRETLERSKSEKKKKKRMKIKEKKKKKKRSKKIAMRKKRSTTTRKNKIYRNNGRLSKKIRRHRQLENERKSRKSVGNRHVPQHMYGAGKHRRHLRAAVNIHVKSRWRRRQTNPGCTSELSQRTVWRVHGRNFTGNGGRHRLQVGHSRSRRTATEIRRNRRSDRSKNQSRDEEDESERDRMYGGNVGRTIHRCNDGSAESAVGIYFGTRHRLVARRYRTTPCGPPRQESRPAVRNCSAGMQEFVNGFRAIVVLMSDMGYVLCTALIHTLFGIFLELRRF